MIPIKNNPASCLLTLISFFIGFMQCSGTSDPQENYTERIPGTNLEFEMVYIPGGTFEMGSPENEPGREADEGPVHPVQVDAFWMAKTEVTWDLYEYYAFGKDTTVVDAITRPSPKIAWEEIKIWAQYYKQLVDAFFSGIDVVSRPSPSYSVYDFGFGTRQRPAIGMSWKAAQYYCEWLTTKTGNTYRLPTEAEWEYACRAGSQAPYSFGNTPDDISQYAWYEENSDWITQPVMKKKPNAFGLYDMHGNAWEYTLDYYNPDGYTRNPDSHPVKNPTGPSEGEKPVLRGGSWEDPPTELRSASRLEFQDWWMERDPQRPRSYWWVIDGAVVGFRVVRDVD